VAASRFDSATGHASGKNPSINELADYFAEVFEGQD